MAKVLVERKVRHAESLMDEALRARIVRPGTFVQYTTYVVPDENGRTGRRTGRGKVEMVRPGHRLPFYIRELKGWVLRSDVAILPKDRWPPE